MQESTKLGDDYPLEGISEEDLAVLSDSTSSHDRPDPASPISNETWSAFLQSSDDVAPPAPETTPAEPLSTLPLISDAATDDVFDENIDWDEAVTLTASNTDQDHEISTSGLTDSTPAHAINEPLTPFVRPVFPDCASDKAQIPGVSPQMVLRTCFRVGEMIGQTVKCHAQQQDVVFELYARVKQSERETLTRTQHFLLTDLFKDSPPYPRAQVAGWQKDSQLDKNAAHFLDLRGELELYWCLCRPDRDPRSTIGWTYTVLSIKPVDWDYVRQARNALFQARGLACSD